jgi:orotate phosphoribosyltransferase
MNDQELAQALKEAALLEGEFTLRSGRKSRYYLDKYLFETQPQLLAELARRFARYAGDVDRIAGAELGGIPLATAAALETGKPFVLVRNSKKVGYGTGKLLEGRIAEGERVLLVEDVVTSGGQAVEAIKSLRHEGAQVVRIVVVLDREQGGKEAIEELGVPFTALFTPADMGIDFSK